MPRSATKELSGSSGAISNLTLGAQITCSGMRSRLETIGTAELPWRLMLADLPGVTPGTTSARGSSEHSDTFGGSI
ncbi:hypothetical protein [Rathayibacter toxicus]|uniref:hypothetical protein n=1 Tax=Rathayibacter toxicus TaxID=145458 RepID=UPI000CE76EB2|nr:hypothetical protein [Rathayibacter toxicus]QOD10462.1 hypothetical protein BSG36_00140 [Rathayibacter toxicus]QWL31419.1 hypothetical protein E2R35_00135 [Rathayibacter toxicus]QWL33510.1 hypothetical protein E2R36_00135 [Rathayibacter toxicus]QWL35645.1 hypothetical protein E2R37_00135 [Rathayibacter toxicus]QWL37734.1 hypothetical protein E2R38_00135 [Rathayibacter toxicus]